MPADNRENTHAKEERRAMYLKDFIDFGEHTIKVVRHQVIQFATLERKATVTHTLDRFASTPTKTLHSSISSACSSSSMNVVVIYNQSPR